MSWLRRPSRSGGPEPGRRARSIAMRFRFLTADVFTERIFGGNPLAVLPDARGLDPARMQQVAREFNLSETVFVLPPDDRCARASAPDLHARARVAVRRPSDRRHGARARGDRRDRARGRDHRDRVRGGGGVGAGHDPCHGRPAGVRRADRAGAARAPAGAAGGRTRGHAGADTGRSHARRWPARVRLLRAAVPDRRGRRRRGARPGAPRPRALAPPARGRLVEGGLPRDPGRGRARRRFPGPAVRAGRGHRGGSGDRRRGRGLGRLARPAHGAARQAGSATSSPKATRSAAPAGSRSRSRTAPARSSRSGSAAARS